VASLLLRLGEWSANRRRLVLGVWVVAVVAILVASGASGNKLNDEFRVPGAESQEALDILEAEFPAAAGADINVVIAAPVGEKVTDERFADGIQDATSSFVALPSAVAVASPLDETGVGQLSADQTIAYFRIEYEQIATDLGIEGVELVEAAAEPMVAAGLQVEFNGPLIEQNEQPEGKLAEAIGILAAVIILLISFGSLVAMGFPILLAIVSVSTTVALCTLAAGVVDVPTVTPFLATMIGLAVGIDYALFVLTRHRQHLAHGMDVVTSIGRANATAGQAVVFAGGTVIIAISGLWLSGIPAVGLMGTGAAIAVVIGVLGAITLLPALLGFAGKNIDRLKVPGLKVRAELGVDEVELAGRWDRWAAHLGRRPWPWLLGALALLFTLAVPMFSIELGQPDAGSSPTSTTQRRAYDLLAEGFGPGFNGPLLIVYDMRDGAVDAAVLDGITAQIAADSGVAAATPVFVSPTETAARVIVFPTTAPQDHATNELVARLRNDVLPTATSGTSVNALVTGQTAFFIDLSQQVQDRLPLFISAIIGVSFILLMMVFRSILVPLKAAVMNLLSIGAAYGVVVAVFQWGWGLSLIGLDEPVPIISFLPMFMFAILFGLSMDYEVFLLSRIREEWLKTGDNHKSVARGLAATARVITSAALIMIAVFLGFVFSDDPILKMFGLGLATAVLVDATVVRMVLVPATMNLLGRANWWLPPWLDRVLPTLDVEGSSLDLHDDEKELVDTKS